MAGQQLTVAQVRQQKSLQIKGSFERMAPELAAALPAHITIEKFNRVVMTAVNSDNALLDADRKSLFEAAIKAAQDGLLPDKREGAFVIFKDKVQWMPMIAGILKKMRNSGELLSVSSQVVYENDAFTVVYGDEERIEHTPLLEGERGKAKAVYAIGKTKDGGIYREVMTLAQVEQVRKVSRAANNGPWVQWWDEMARKTVLRRLAKRMPQSTDIERVLSRDDEMYAFGRAAAGEAQAGRMFSRVEGNPLLEDDTDRKDDLPNHDRETGEIDGDWSEPNDDKDSGAGVENKGANAKQAPQPDTSAERNPADAGSGKNPGGSVGGTAGSASSAPADAPGIIKARDHGAATAKKGGARRPPRQIEDAAEKDAWFAAFDSVVVDA